MLKVLVVDDDQGLRLSVKSVLTSTGRFEVEEAFDGINALEKFKAADPRPNVVILDVDMPRMNGLETLQQIKEIDPGVIVIMLTAHASLGDAVQAVKDGAFNYLSKPVTAEDLLALLDRALQAHTLISNIAASAPVMVEAGRKIIGNTTQMMKVFNIIHKLAKVETPVLIRGASGTGKELVAKAIHFNSSRKDGKFVAINCSAIPENLFESELFGHEKGSFTGAHDRKIGKFQYAEGGTLFLDEVGDMPALMQVKILRVLQEKLFTPVGSNREIQSNVRIIAATNRPLEEMIKNGSFREDLFYRLNVVPIFLPSLAERKDDIERMIHIFIRKFNETHRRRVTGVSADALNVLKKYSWPGNIRELENVIEHSFVLESGNVITLASLPESLLEACGVNLLELPDQGTSEQMERAVEPVGFEGGRDDLDLSGDDDEELTEEGSLDPSLAGSLDFNAQKEAFEREFIVKALRTFKGRINQTALHANIPKKTLLRKIEKYGIIAKDYSD
ncbi:MAG: sigma-54-dependent Fis family transcriptional regulator [Bdellovibrionaceae bacterium]|nr:sigma-54-dependent Fis family transcriptional regulator [Pseudobdellovibrionaceae bacterium]